MVLLLAVLKTSHAEADSGVAVCTVQRLLEAIILVTYNYIYLV